MSQRADKTIGFRFWERKWSKVKASFFKQPVVLVESDEVLSENLKNELIREFAFLENALEVEFVVNDKSNFVQKPFTYLELIQTHQPSFLISIREKYRDFPARMLRYFDIPFAQVNKSKLQPSKSIEVFELSRANLSFVHGRMAIYVHEPSLKNLPVILKAYFEVRRQYPDLVLLMSGVSVNQFTEMDRDVIVASSDSSKEKTRLADIITSEKSGFLDEWAAYANVTLLLDENKIVEEKLQHALKAGSAVVTFGVKPKEKGLLVELLSVGAIWTTFRPQGLVSALGQALEPEKAALTVLQSLEYLSPSKSLLQSSIDKLLERN